MEKHGRKFSAREKESALAEWNDMGGGKRNARRISRVHACAVSSLYRWHEQYDGTTASLANGDQTPHRLWNKYTAEDLAIIKETVAKYPNASRPMLLGRLRIEQGFARSMSSLRRMLRVLKIAPPRADIARHNGHYDTPTLPGVKWQIDVKYVPKECMREIPDSCFYYKSGGVRYYQYSCIDECTRKRFLYFYDGIGKHQTIDFFKRCVAAMGHLPLIVQTDNGMEFCNAKTDYRLQRMYKAKEHEFTAMLTKCGVTHKRIAPATPRHDGKVERAHRTDNEEFYAFQSFKNLDHARDCLKTWVYEYNYIRPHGAFDWRTPADVEQELLAKLHANDNNAPYVDMVRVQGHPPQKVERVGKVRFCHRDMEWAFATRPLQSLNT